MSNQKENTEKAWAEHFELLEKRDAMNKPQKATPIRLLHNPSELGERVHKFCQMLDGLLKMIDTLKGQVEVANNIIENATYVVDYGNFNSKRNRLPFPQDFLGAKQYFEYVKDTYDWAEILMSVNINYGEKYIEQKRKMHDKSKT